jgi:hypothetical protein
MDLLEGTKRDPVEAEWPTPATWVAAPTSGWSPSRRTLERHLAKVCDVPGRDGPPTKSKSELGCGVISGCCSRPYLRKLSRLSLEQRAGKQSSHRPLQGLRPIVGTGKMIGFHGGPVDSGRGNFWTCHVSLASLRNARPASACQIDRSASVRRTKKRKIRRLWATCYS